MIFEAEAPHIYRLYWLPRGEGVVGWGWQDFANPDERYDYLDSIRPSISRYVFEDGEDLEDPQYDGPVVFPPEDLERRDA